MGVTNNQQELPLAIKIVKKEDMACLERELIEMANKKGFVGFPTPYNFPLTCTVPFDGGVTHEQLLITDLIGSSLSWFSKSKPLTIVQVYNIGIQLLQRVRDFHSIGYVHGDIKPCNILIGKAKTPVLSNSLPKESQRRTLGNSRQNQTELNLGMFKKTKNTNNMQSDTSGHIEQLLYLIDFGICTPFVGKDGKLLAQKVLRNIRCSPQYAGLNQLNGMSNLHFLQLYRRLQTRRCRSNLLHYDRLAQSEALQGLILPA